MSLSKGYFTEKTHLVMILERYMGRIIGRKMSKTHLTTMLQKYFVCVALTLLFKMLLTYPPTQLLKNVVLVRYLQLTH
jgi:hypothetical protein